MPKKILLFSRDPGGANTVIPLIKPLKIVGYEVKLYGKDFALKRYNYFGLNGIDILTEIDFINFDNILIFLQKELPDVIVTGTSADDITEKYFWAAAKQLKIPSFAILDNWMNYGVRFSEFGVSNLEKYNGNKTHKYLPTKIFVMDDYAKSEMAKDGISDGIIAVTGQPYFELLISWAKNYSKQKVENIRKSLLKNFSNSLELILFLSSINSGTNLRV